MRLPAGASQISRKGIARTVQLTALLKSCRSFANLALGYYKCTTSGFWEGFCTRPMAAGSKKTEEKVLETLEFVGLGAKAFDMASTISQGTAVAFHRHCPDQRSQKLILFDEPTGGLIQEDTAMITELIRKINKRGTWFCLIEHKMRMVMDLADRIVVF